MSVSATIDLHDWEIPRIEEALRILNSFKSGMTFAEFERAANDEFGERNFKVVVLWEIGGLEAIPTEMVEPTLKLMLRPGIPTPEISIVGRVKEIDFDHERQRWDVQRATLGLDEPGAIGRNGVIITPASSTAFVDKKS